MFGRANFRDCIADNLKGKGFGEKRTKEVMEIFERKVKAYDREGMRHPDADFKAMAETFEEVKFLANEKAKRAMRDMYVQVYTGQRIEQGANVTTSSLVGDRGAGLVGGKGVGMAFAINSMIHMDPRFKGVNYEDVHKSYFGKYWALMSDVMDNFSKGTFGVQRGAAHFPNVARELFGRSTGDTAAKEIADAYRKVSSIMVDDFNRMGGSLRKRVDFYMPQKQSMSKMINGGSKRWIDDHMNWLDWDKMTWPDGDVIEPDQRAPLLQKIYATMSTDGAANLDDKAFRGRGRALGNQLDKHRFMLYKDADAWLAMHEAYGDGNVFDVISQHIERMARSTAQVQMFGSNPNTWIDNAKNIARKRVGVLQAEAAEKGDVSKKSRMLLADYDSAIRKVENVFTATMHKNSMDPNSTLGITAATTSNLLMSAQLHSAVLLAAPGDAMTTAFVRALNGSAFTSGLNTYTKGMSPGGYGNMERMLARAGFVFDETVANTFAAERFSGMSTYLSPVSRRIGDIAMRATGLTRHTNIARGTAQLEQMGLLVEFNDKSFSELPFKHVMERYGITSRDWDVVRKLPPSSPNGGDATFMRPLDIMDSNLIDKDQLYQKFFSFVHAESRYMVPASTVEASVGLKGVTRPDTMAGLMLHSFAMYKNYPMTFAMQFGRLALSRQDMSSMSKTTWLGALAAGMTLVGATGVQLKELKSGRTPMPMDNLKFWGKAFMSGGAAGIWGDFLFSGTNEYGRDLRTQAGGPIVGLGADIVNLTVGSAFNWVNEGDPFDANLAGRSLEFAKRNIPGSKTWYAQLVLEREMWDRLQEMVDPKAHQKFRRKMQKQKELYGNAYWWQPGEQ
jgi:hypothetical protein